MKLKSILLIVICLIFYKVQAQIPSINETKRILVLHDTVKITEFQNLSGLVAKSQEKIEKFRLELVAKDKTKEKDDLTTKEIEGLDLLIEYEKANLDLLLEKVSTYSETDEEEKVYIDFFDDEIQKLIDNNITLKSKLSGMENLKDIDSILKIINKNKRNIKIKQQQKERKIITLNKYKCLFPTVRKFDREVFFHDMYNNKTNKTILLNSFALNSNSNATAVQTEVVTDNLSAFRLSFGSVVSLASSDEETTETEEQQKKDETEQEAFSRLINGGGNFYLEAVFPLLCTNPNNGNQFTFYGYGSIRGAMDVEGFGNNIDTSTGNYTFGLNTYFGLSSDSKKFNFFVQANGNVSGGTDYFYKNLGLVHEKAFFNGKLIAGMTILNNFRFSAILSAYGSDEKIRSNKITVGIQILPGI